MLHLLIMAFTKSSHTLVINECNTDVVEGSLDTDETRQLIIKLLTKHINCGARRLAQLLASNGLKQVNKTTVDPVLHSMETDGMVTFHMDNHNGKVWNVAEMNQPQDFNVISMEPMYTVCENIIINGKLNTYIIEIDPKVLTKWSIAFTFESRKYVFTIMWEVIELFYALSMFYDSKDRDVEKFGHSCTQITNLQLGNLLFYSATQIMYCLGWFIQRYQDKIGFFAKNILDKMTSCSYDDVITKITCEQLILHEFVVEQPNWTCCPTWSESKE